MSVYSALCQLPMDVSKPYNSHKPLFSNYALCMEAGVAGISGLLLHYNRKTRPLWTPLLTLPGTVTDYVPRYDQLAMATDRASLRLAYYARDAFVFSCHTAEPIRFFCQESPELLDNWIAARTPKQVIIRGYSHNGDDRDPDPQVAFLAGLRVIRGKLSVRRGVYRIHPDENGEIHAAFAASVMNISLPELETALAQAPESLDTAREALRNWAEDCIGPQLTLPAREDAREPFLRAVGGLLMNLTEAPGELAGHISSFPNRGGYPTHFLWDSAFQNLAYEKMNPALARDSILQLTDNIRADGRISHFHCSTWSRPRHTQPALVGWMTLRYLDEVENDRELMNRVFPALEANNHWWLNQRMTRHGLIFCDDGLETGQDDSPRFDNGAILAVDMNSYAVNQMRCTAEIARRLGKKRKAGYWEREADALAARIVQLLYDPEENLFFDADAKTGRRQNLFTSSAFLPLWAGVPLSRERTEAMIRDQLLNLARFFGAVPFPSVAYDQPCYQPEQWWRGPTWPSIFWLVLGVLKKYGFEAEHREAQSRLHELMIQDKKLHELYNSQTGQGMGNEEQGWSAAVFIRSALDLLD